MQAIGIRPLLQAVESFALCLGEWGWVPRNALPRRVDVLLFSAAGAAILPCYSDAQGLHRDVFRSKYLNVLDFILGNDGGTSVAPALRSTFVLDVVGLVSGCHDRLGGLSYACPPLLRYGHIA